MSEEFTMSMYASKDDLIAAMRARITELEQSAIPAGYALVPVEPTGAMLDAGFKEEEIVQEYGVNAYVKDSVKVWEAMLEAAPAPSQQKREVEPMAFLVRDIAHDFGVSALEVCTVLKHLGFGDQSVNAAVTPEMAAKLKAYDWSKNRVMGWPLSEYEQALGLLAGLHPNPPVDGPPMALAELIFEAVLEDARGLKEEIAKKERNLELMRGELARRVNSSSQK